MNHYNPNKTPDPQAWLQLDENVRLTLIERYHEQAKIELPDAMTHAVIHAIVENQLAEGIPDVIQTFERLRAEGLDRHDTIHAIGSVLVQHVHRLWIGSENAAADPNQAYFAELREYTAEKWLSS